MVGYPIDAGGEEFRIEIVSWDWHLTVALSPAATPAELRFQGGLTYARGFHLFGRVLAPVSQSGKTIEIWISSFGEEFTFGPDDIDEVGRFYFSPPPKNRADWRISLLLPESAIAPLTTSLGTVSKYLFVRTFDHRDGEASIDFYSFSSTLPDGVASTVYRDKL